MEGVIGRSHQAYPPFSFMVRIDEIFVRLASLEGAQANEFGVSWRFGYSERKDFSR